MKKLYSPRGEMELLILRSVLEDAGIPFFVRNDTFGSLYMARYAEAYNRKVVYVPEALYDEAAVLLEEFLERTGAGEELAAEREAEQEPGALGRLVHRLLALVAPHLAPEPTERPTLTVIRNDGPPSGESGDEGEEPADAEEAYRRPELRLVHPAREE